MKSKTIDQTDSQLSRKNMQKVQQISRSLFFVLATVSVILVLLTLAYFDQLSQLFPHVVDKLANHPYFKPYNNTQRNYTAQSPAIKPKNLPASPSTGYKDPLIVHYILFHTNLNPGPESSISFIECLSILSVMKNLAPDIIYLHTNVPGFWPFITCEGLITNWKMVRVVPAQLKFTMNGKLILQLAHEADIRRLEVLMEYGGLVLDFDVYMINGDKLRALMDKYTCIACTENELKLNAGFLACRKGAIYPRMVLEESYMKRFDPSSWEYNSGDLPWKLHNEHKETAYIADGICNAPDWINRAEFLDERGNYDWSQKIAHHSYLHDRNYSMDTLGRAKTSFGDMLQWILLVAPAPPNQIDANARRRIQDFFRDFSNLQKG